MQKRALTVIVMMSLLMALPACNTMRGLGQDIQSGGRALEGSAERNGGRN